ncbi:MAG: winged helix-turn-helix domain-containing protein [Acidimicrobiia bacterium]|nr:winged helix-turn-helix domain-containing protein [Acidimicrobiia bacterium]
MPELSIRVLGPIEVAVDDEVVVVGGRNQRAVLVGLVLSLNHAVSADQLALAIWGDDPPPSAHATLQSHISHLRTLLGDSIRFADDAYTLCIDPTRVDSVMFERLVQEARLALGFDAMEARFRAISALQMWRGDAFGDLGDEEFTAIEARRLDLLRQEAIELRLEADIQLGEYESAIGHLQAAIDDDPYREHLWYLMMTALARAGRRVEALRSYRQVSELLATAGLDPSSDLTDLEQQILLETPPVKARLVRHPETAY